MFSSCRSSPDFTPPPTTPVFSSPAEMPEYDSATSAMEIDFEHSGSQSSTDISYNGAPDKESMPTDCDLVTKTMTIGCDFPGCLPRPGIRMAESPLPLQRFLGEEENRVPSLVQYNILPNATTGPDEPSTRVNRGSRDRRRRKRRARRASSIYVEGESLSLRDRLVRDFGES